MTDIKYGPRVAVTHIRCHHLPWQRYLAAQALLALFQFPEAKYRFTEIFLHFAVFTLRLKAFNLHSVLTYNGLS